MHTLTDSHAEHELTQLATRFEHWRQHRSSLAESIPETLWAQAVALTEAMSRAVSHLEGAGLPLPNTFQNLKLKYDEPKAA